MKYKLKLITDHGVMMLDTEYKTVDLAVASAKAQVKLWGSLGVRHIDVVEVAE